MLTEQDCEALLKDQSWRTDGSLNPEEVAELEDQVGIVKHDPAAQARVLAALGPLPELNLPDKK